MNRKFFALFILLGFCMAVFGQDSGKKSDRGGFVPCLATCLVGPRVGLEMNEGKELYDTEWILLGANVLGSVVGPTSIGPLVSTAGRLYAAYEMGGKKNGFKGALASYFIGPRVGYELHYRKIRRKELFLIIPCINIIPAVSIALEAYHGMTMSEIEKKENLRR